MGRVRTRSLVSYPVSVLSTVSYLGVWLHALVNLGPLGLLGGLFLHPISVQPCYQLHGGWCFLDYTSTHKVSRDGCWTVRMGDYCCHQFLL